MEEEKKKNGKVLILAIGLVIGLIIGLAVMFFIKPSKTIARIGLDSITENTIYSKLQKFYPNDVLSMILEDVDNSILSKKYKEDNKMKEEVKKQAENYIESYTMYYGSTEEEFLKQCGFDSIDDFAKYLELEYRRNQYYIDYLAELIGQDKIKAYYDENNFGKVEVKHILVRTSEELTSDEAKALATEIIEKLNEGANFDEVAEEYKTKNENVVITEDLGEITFADPLETSFVEAVKEMKDKTYSTEPVETSYGFHVIYRVGSKALSLEDAKNDIIEALYEDIDVDIKSKEEKLIELRKEAGLKFTNKKFKNLYDELVKSYEKEATE